MAQNAQAVDQYSNFDQQVADNSDNFGSGDAFGGGDPFDGALGTPDSSSFASPSEPQQSVQAQEAKVDAEFSDAGGNDFLYPASSGMQSPEQIENASSYASDVMAPPKYPRSEPPAKKYYEKSSKKKKTWAKKSKKSKNKYAKNKKNKKGKKIAKHKRKKNNRISRNDT